MKRISDLEKCIPDRSNIHIVQWEVLKKKKTNDKTVSEKNTLPLSILLKIGGHPKIVDPYRIISPGDLERFDANMKNSTTSSTPVNIISFGDHGLESPKPGKDKPGLPPKPVLLHNRKVLGRYFPKPIPLDDRRFINSYVSGNMKKNAGKYRAGNISVGMVNDTGKKKFANFDSSNVLKESKTLSNYYNPRLLKSRTSAFEKNGDRLFLSANLRSHSSIGGIGIAGSVDSQSDKSDYSTIQKISTSTRHVTFPDKSIDFSDILKGTPKMLHRREMEEIHSAPESEKNIPHRVTFKETTSISVC